MLDQLNLGGLRCDSVGTYHITAEQNFSLGEAAFRSLGIQLFAAQGSKNGVQMPEMFLEGVGVNDDVVDVDGSECWMGP